MWRSSQSVSNRGDGQVPQARSDGWMEIEMGEFFNDEGEEGDIEMSLMEVKGGQKSGLIVEGIEMRPSHGGKKGMKPQLAAASVALSNSGSSQK
ncbi:putative F-box protein PP2-B12 [Cinnamomum micranthum f. kanehirae]|uniref:Putative F-box protein PP2-B12 n=1 Tax=Cinnamomum micranthum f. kanehirae TaxID=337451 RepID=A0A3S3NCF7_9MAGN|nr:putative F-box protein PP2-B12 [Cinnamomum micranthum f. kanehirae]